MIRGRSRLAISASLLLFWIVCPLPARAAAVQTFLGLETDPVITVGVHPTVTVRLTSAAGPIAGAALEIQLAGRQTKRLFTDGDGRATTVLARDLDAGDYQVQAVFRGTPDLLASASAVTIVHVTPASLTVRTVPPVADVPLLRIDGGRPLSTGADGTIRIPITTVRRYLLEVTLPPADADRQLRFDRWGDGSRETKRTIRLPGRTDLAIGLEVSHPVGFSFLDSTGAAVDPARIETMLIANDRGDVLEPGAVGSEWLVGNRIVSGADGLMSVPIEYRLQEVGVHGSNVVDRGRLHYRPDGEISTWVIPLLLYTLTIYGQDALFGSALGSSLQLEYPNGTVESVRLDPFASATLSALPRGNYRAVIEHPPGFAVSTPLVLSRDQVVRVPVISYLDAGFVLGSGITLAIALVLFGGRPVGRVGRRALRRLVGAPLMAVRAPAAVGRVGRRALRRLVGAPLMAVRAPAAVGRVGRRALRRLVGAPLMAVRAPAAVGRVGRRALRRLVGAQLMAVRAQAALVRRLPQAAGARRPGELAPSLRMVGGLDFTLLVPMQMAAPASFQPPIDDFASPVPAPASAGQKGRRRQCPDCGNRVTARARRCRACGWHKL